MNTGTQKNYFDEYNKYGWWFVGAALILLAVFLLYPIGYSLYLSLQNCRGSVCTFNGFGNITRLFEDELFKIALGNTFLFFVVQVPIMLTLALVIAAVLNNPKIKYQGLYRTAIFLPCVTSLVSCSILFKSMFAVDGIINSSLMTIGIIDKPIPWLIDPFWTKVVIILTITWRWTGYNMIFYLSALQNIPKSYYEAADIDGASKIKQFLFITVPLLKPMILFTAVMSTIGTLQLFDEPMNLTSGGANPASTTAGLTLSVYIYKLSFIFTPNFGYAATVSYVVVFFVALLSFFQFKVLGDKQ